MVLGDSLKAGFLESYQREAALAAYIASKVVTAERVRTAAWYLNPELMHLIGADTPAEAAERVNNAKKKKSGPNPSQFIGALLPQERANLKKAVNGAYVSRKVPRNKKKNLAKTKRCYKAQVCCVIPRCGGCQTKCC